MDPIHLVLLSNRQDGVATAMQSVCLNSADPVRLHFHIVGSSTDLNLPVASPACFRGGARVELYTVRELTLKLKDAGFDPVWTWTDDGAERTNLSVHPADWDNSSIHKDPYNLMRFYLPHVEPFLHMEKLLFLDDDVVIFKDVAQAWDEPLQGPAIMSASCQNWIWNACDEFKTSRNFSYLEVPYLGFGHIGTDRSVADATCSMEAEQECIPKGLLTFLENKSREINGEEHAINIQRLRHATAWNYGFNKFDLTAWRHRQITQKFIQWMRLNHEFKLFPATSVAYGLGIAMLTKIGSVQCFDEKSDILQGFGFVSSRDMRAAGYDSTSILKSFGVHFNGPNKPWQFESANPFAAYYLKYAPKKVARNYWDKEKAHNKRRHQRDSSNLTSFVLVSDPRSGAEWLMDLLDGHEDICASGESDDEAAGFPRHGLRPGSHLHLNQFDDHLRQSNKMNLISIASEGRLEGLAAAPRNFYAPSRQEVSTADGMNQTAYVKGNVASHEVRSCQAKVGCSWDSLSKLVWKAVYHPSLCSAERTQTALMQTQSINRHFDVVCTLYDKALLRVGKQAYQTDPKVVYAEAFRVFLRQQMRYSLITNDAHFDSDKEKRQVLPCHCPKSKVIIGQKVFHEWIGDLPHLSLKGGDWEARPWGVNFNVENATERGLPDLNLVDILKELGTKVILFERADTLARFVSVKSAEQSNIGECTTSECVAQARDAKVNIDTTELLAFSEATKLRHLRTRSLLQAAGITPLELTYEACVQDAKRCVSRITRFLQVSEPTSNIEDDSDLKKLLRRPQEQIANFEDVRHKLLAMMARVH